MCRFGRGPTKLRCSPWLRALLERERRVKSPPAGRLAEPTPGPEGEHGLQARQTSHSVVMLPAPWLGTAARPHRAGEVMCNGKVNSSNQEQAKSSTKGRQNQVHGTILKGRRQRAGETCQVQRRADKAKYQGQAGPSTGWTPRAGEARCKLLAIY